MAAVALAEFDFVWGAEDKWTFDLSTLDTLPVYPLHLIQNLATNCDNTPNLDQLAQMAIPKIPDLINERQIGNLHIGFGNQSLVGREIPASNCIGDVIQFRHDDCRVDADPDCDCWQGGF